MRWTPPQFDKKKKMGGIPRFFQVALLLMKERWRLSRTSLRRGSFVTTSFTWTRAIIFSPQLSATSRNPAQRFSIFSDKMARFLTTQGRRLYPRENAAVVAFVLVSRESIFSQIAGHYREKMLTCDLRRVQSLQFSLVLVVISFRVFYKWLQRRLLRSLPLILSIFTVSLIRLLIASFEFGFPPNQRTQTQESAIAILDTVSLIPLSCALAAATLPCMDFEIETSAATSYVLSNHFSCNCR